MIIMQISAGMGNPMMSDRVRLCNSAALHVRREDKAAGSDDFASNAWCEDYSDRGDLLPAEWIKIV